MSTAVIVFVRKPELGKVKTRLAQGVGQQKALDIYIELLRHTSAVVEAAPYDAFVYYHGAIVEQDMWTHQRCHKALQVAGDLGTKLKAAFEEVLQKYDRALVIGSDCPLLSADHLRACVQQLDQQEIVIGPTLDGGYYLLGMQSLQPWLFEDIPWSSGDEFEVTLRKCLRHQKSTHILAPLPDIDYKEDWDKYGWEL